MFIDLSPALRLAHLLHVGGDAVVVGVSTLLGLLGKVFKDILGDNAYAFRRMERLFGIDTPHFLALHVVFHAHSTLVVHTESKHILVVDGVDDGVGMEFVSKRLLCG